MSAASGIYRKGVAQSGEFWFMIPITLENFARKVNSGMRCPEPKGEAVDESSEFVIERQRRS